MDLNAVLDFLGDSNIEKMASNAGTDKQHTINALSGALPTILSALQGNSQSKLGQRQLEKAIEKDHDGSLLDHVSEFLDNPAQANGKGILKHTLGSRRTTVENMLSQKSGVSSSSMSKIMEMAAPLVMAYLGRERNSNSSGGGGITDIIASFLGGGDKPNQSGGFDISDIAGMFLNSRKGGIAGFLGGLLGR